MLRCSGLVITVSVTSLIWGEHAELFSPGPVFACRYGPWLDVNWVTPTSATTCSVLFDYFLDEGVLAIDEKAVAEGLAASNQVQQEDVVLCESVQRGLGSPVYDSGRYGRPEGPMLHFHQHLHKSLMGAN